MMGKFQNRQKKNAERDRERAEGHDSTGPEGR